MGVRIGGHAGPVYASAPVPGGCGKFFAVVFGLPLAAVAMWNALHFWPLDLILGGLVALALLGRHVERRERARAAEDAAPQAAVSDRR